MIRLIKYLVIFLITASLLWTVGLLSFVNLIQSYPTSPIITKSDAIVVLTGGSNRLNHALSLLTQNNDKQYKDKRHKDKRLFISGAGKGVDINSMLILSGPLPNNIHDYVDHIDLGYNATNTEENAIETSEWLKFHQFDHFILVTANYHMPRSILEFSHHHPGGAIIPYPISPENFTLNEWWLNKESLKYLISEYHKYLIKKRFIN